jgi:ADP-ribose pyrophosphatase
MVDPALDYTFISSEDRFRSEYVAYRGETYRLPDGRVAGPFGILDYPDWVNVLALTADQQAVLVRQFRPGPRKVTLELPGGAVSAGDPSLEASLRRELEEETGYGKGELLYLGGLSPNSASHSNRVHSFLAQGVERIGDLRPDDTEFLEVVLMPLDQLIRTVVDGGLDQAMHVATIFLALVALDRVK